LPHSFYLQNCGVLFKDSFEDLSLSGGCKMNEKIEITLLIFLYGSIVMAAIKLLIFMFMENED
jgi:hypothetical protein